MASPVAFGVEVTGIRLTHNYGNLRAFVNVRLTINDQSLMLMRGVRIVQQPHQRAYCQMPCQQSKVDGRYYSIIKTTNPDLAIKIKKAALAAYKRAIGH